MIRKTTEGLDVLQAAFILLDFNNAANAVDSTTKTDSNGQSLLVPPSMIIMAESRMDSHDL